LAGAVDRDFDVLALRRLDAPHLRDVDALALAEADQRARRLALGVERRLGARPLHRVVAAGLTLGERPHVYADPARRPPGPQVGLALDPQSGVAQTLRDVRGELWQRAGAATVFPHVARGQFLDADLEQQVATHARVPDVSLSAASFGFTHLARSAGSVISGK